VVSQTFAARSWPGESAVGKRVRFGPPTSKDPWHTVVGIAGDSRVGVLKGADDPNVYLPYGSYDAGVTPGYVLLRTAGDPRALVNAARARIVLVDRDLAIARAFTLDDLVERATWRDRFVAYLFGLFAAMALVLAALGLYGVLAFTVALQTREIGIRLLLGAPIAGVRRMMMQRGLQLSAAGLVMGLAGALMTTPLLTRQLFNVSPYDRVTIGLTMAVLATVTIAASAAPALRATRVDPVTALRQE
jgi:ABC-type antimicrobial peptide transport system permease subunit